MVAGIAVLGAGMIMPVDAEAKADVRPRELVDIDIEGTALELTEARGRFGAEINSVSKVLHNVKTGESVRFLTYEDGGVKWLYRAEPGGFVPFAHRHEEDEIYDVVSGMISVCIDGEWQDAHAGDRVVIPAMSVHEAFNPSDEAVEVLVDFDPATPEVQAMGKAYWVACELGWTGKNGAPNMLKLLPAVRQTGAKAYPEGVPKWLVDLVA